MARVPKYAYRVTLTRRLGTGLTMETHNYETLPGAWGYREIALAKGSTVKVEVMVILDESTPSHRHEGVIHARTVEGRPRV